MRGGGEEEDLNPVRLILETSEIRNSVMQGLGYIGETA